VLLGGTAQHNGAGLTSGHTGELDQGVLANDHFDFDGIERLALVTGGEIASTFEHPDQVKLGGCDLIEEVIIGEDTLIKFSGVAAGQACTSLPRSDHTHPA
jgi:T-complex protein 1 subunit beta